MCKTEQVLRKSSTNFQWDVRLGASGPYVICWYSTSLHVYFKKAQKLLVSCELNNFPSKNILYEIG